MLVKETGLILEKVEYDSSHHQFTISERYKQGKSFKERNYNNGFERLLCVFKKLSYSRKAKKLNNESRGDQAIFYIRKNNVKFNN
ncbi:MAG: hypothetical protein GQ525_00590 [Draconibacterium sp.]|nr:hypothetical protein [Draconibacterium sp.]